eukprot:maker-scaffold184_size276635-snap-gene-1.34 protein:Tk08115 transcript:maker-scaffold184_size276635-snap-gene-1.34-mRNA-1 annotation:"uncharacterized protein LOC641564 precursor"
MSVAMETWTVFHSSDGPNQSRNALGGVSVPRDFLYQDWVGPRSGVVPYHIRFPTDSLVCHGIKSWNEFPELGKQKVVVLGYLAFTQTQIDLGQLFGSFVDSLWFINMEESFKQPGTDTLRREGFDMLFNPDEFQPQPLEPRDPEIPPTSEKPEDKFNLTMNTAEYNVRYFQNKEASENCSNNPEQKVVPKTIYVHHHHHHQGSDRDGTIANKCLGQPRWPGTAEGRAWAGGRGWPKAEHEPKAQQAKKQNGFDLLFNPSGEDEIRGQRVDNRVVITPETLRYNLHVFQGGEANISHINHHYYPYPNQSGPQTPPQVPTAQRRKRDEERSRWLPCSDTCLFLTCIILLILVVLTLILVLVLREGDWFTFDSCEEGDVVCQELLSTMECGLIHKKIVYKTTDSQSNDGLSRDSFSTLKIVGGEEVEVNEYPWQAAIEPLQSATWTFRPFCGGTLLNEDWIISAAHCFKGRSSSGIQVALGEHDVTNMTESRRVVRRVDEILIHPDYDPESNDNDMALLRLEKSVSFSSYTHIRPVCFPLAKPDPGSEVIVSGWGKTDALATQTSDILREATLKMVSKSECEELLQQPLTSSMMCAGDLETGKDSCSINNMWNNAYNYGNWVAANAGQNIGQQTQPSPQFQHQNYGHNEHQSALAPQYYASQSEHTAIGIPMNGGSVYDPQGFSNNMAGQGACPTAQRLVPGPYGQPSRSAGKYLYQTQVTSGEYLHQTQASSGNYQHQTQVTSGKFLNQTQVTSEKHLPQTQAISGTYLPQTQVTSGNRSLDSVARKTAKENKSPLREMERLANVYTGQIQPGQSRSDSAKMPPPSQVPCNSRMQWSGNPKSLVAYHREENVNYYPILQPGESIEPY